jgi:hypothetical protein
MLSSKNFAKSTKQSARKLKVNLVSEQDPMLRRSKDSSEVLYETSPKTFTKSKKIGDYANGTDSTDEE